MEAVVKLKACQCIFQVTAKFWRHCESSWWTEHWWKPRSVHEWCWHHWSSLYTSQQRGKKVLIKNLRTIHHLRWIDWQWPNSVRNICQNAISKRPFSHRGHKGTAEEDIKLYWQRQLLLTCRGGYKTKAYFSVLCRDILTWLINYQIL